MSIQEKLKAEEGNYSSIVIYGDGSNFVHAYERSAYAFTKMIKSYEVKVQIPKNGGISYCHIGFPVATMEKLIKQYNFSSDCPDEKTKVWVMKTEEDYFSEEEFLTWKRVSTIEQARKNGEKTGIIGPVGGTASASVAASEPEKSNRQQTAGGSVLPEEARLAVELVHEIHNLELTDYTPWMAMEYLVKIKKRIAQWKTRTRK